jgi:hypothetical protein
MILIRFTLFDFFNQNNMRKGAAALKNLPYTIKRTEKQNASRNAALTQRDIHTN